MCPRVSSPAELHRLLNLSQTANEPTPCSDLREWNVWYEVKDVQGDLAGNLANVRGAPDTIELST